MAFSWGGGGSNNLTQLAEKLEGEYAEAKSANIKRYQEALGIYDEIVGMYEPGGGFGAGYEAQLEQTKTKDVGTAISQNISSGLYGVQTTSGAASRWEAEVGQPARLRLEDLRKSRYGEALQGKAGVIERRVDEYPDQGLIANLYAQASQANVGMPSIGGGGSGSSASSMFKKAMSQLGTQPSRGYGTGPSVNTGPGHYQEPTTGFEDMSGWDYYPGGGSPVANVYDASGYSTPTPSQATTIESRLRQQYPQMYESGWGKTSNASYNVPMNVPGGSLWNF